MVKKLCKSEVCFVSHVFYSSHADNSSSTNNLLFGEDVVYSSVSMATVV